MVQDKYEPARASGGTKITLVMSILQQEMSCKSNYEEQINMDQKANSYNILKSMANKMNWIPRMNN